VWKINLSVALRRWNLPRTVRRSTVSSSSSSSSSSDLLLTPHSGSSHIDALQISSHKNRPTSHRLHVTDRASRRLTRMMYPVVHTPVIYTTTALQACADCKQVRALAPHLCMSTTICNYYCRSFGRVLLFDDSVPFDNPIYLINLLCVLLLWPHPEMNCSVLTCLAYRKENDEMS